MTKLEPLPFGYAGALVSAGVMLLLGIFGNVNFYTGMVDMMQQGHMFFSLSLVGIILGMIEAAVVSFVLCYAFAWVYNRFS